MAIRRLQKFSLLVVAVCCWFASQPAAWSDTVYLTNQQTLEGLVIRENASDVTFQVAWQGFVMLDRGSIARIIPSSESERAHLLEQWREHQNALLRQEEERQEFEVAQRAKGFVLHEGQWVSQEELDALNAQARAEEQRRQLETALKQEQQARKHEEEARLAQQEELKTLNERLRIMYFEQQRLQQELFTLRCLLAETVSRHHASDDHH